MASFAVSASFTGTGTFGATFTSGRAITVDFEGTGALELDSDAIVYDRNIIASWGALTVGLEIDDALLVIDRSQVWWNTNWLYRRNLIVQANREGIEADHPIICYVTRDIIAKRKANLDLSDVEVLRLVSYVPEVWVRVPFVATLGDNTIFLQWNNQIDIPPDTRLERTYFIYYGNRDLVGDEEVEEYVPEDYPISLVYGDPRLQLTRPEEHWHPVDEDGLIVSVADVYRAKMSLVFDGDQIRIKANKGPAYGIAEVQIDDGAWTQVDLHDTSSIDFVDIIVFEQTNLGLGRHTLRYRQSGLKSPTAVAYDINFTHIEYRKNARAIDVIEEANETLLWGSVIGGVVGGV